MTPGTPESPPGELAAIATELDEAAALHRLIAHMHATREAEAARIAREVHDVLGQALTALKIDLAWLSKHLDEAATSTGRAALADRLAEARSTATSAIATVRGLATALRPSVLDDLGLAAAIEWQGGQLAASTGVVYHFDLDQDVQMSSEIATAMFRIFQQLATNVARHARGSEVSVRLWRDDSHVVLEVADDGTGIPSGALDGPRSLGLLEVRERARLCGGQVRFSAEGRRGTMVTVRIPGAGQ